MCEYVTILFRAHVVFCKSEACIIANLLCCFLCITVLWWLGKAAGGLLVLLFKFVSKMLLYRVLMKSRENSRHIGS